MDSLFKSIYEHVNTQVNVGALDWKRFLICTAVALLCGALTALFYVIRNKRFNRSFLFALVGAPIFISVIIAIASRNVGITLSIAGVFTMIRFRSQPTDGRELTNILGAVAIGITSGCGFIAYAVIATLLLGVLNLLFALTPFGNTVKRQLRITIPESLDYTGVFDDILEKYASAFDLVRVRTVAMGSLYQLTYTITEKDPAKEKEMIDELRTRNGNLEIACMAADFDIRDKI